MKFDRDQQAELFDASAELLVRLRLTAARLAAAEEDVLAESDLDCNLHDALRALRDAHPAGVPTMALGGRLASRGADLSRLADRLAARGLVAREHPPGNRRTVHLRITDAGLDLLADLAGPLRACGERLLGHLSDAQKAALIDLLEAARRPHGEAA